MTNPFETMMADVPVGSVPPLEQARRELERLQDQHDTIEREAEETGTEHELGWSEEWRDLCRALQRARSRVAAEEYAQARRQSIPQPKPEGGQ